MKLNEKGLESRQAWEACGYKLPEYDRAKMIEETKANPYWIHFGAGNIFRAFQANVIEQLLNKKELECGLIVAEGYDYEIIEKINHPSDDLSILVTLKADGNIEKSVIGSVAESLTLDRENAEDMQRLTDIFKKESLQMATFTITEKGYSLVGGNGEILPAIAKDFENGPEMAESYLGKVAALLYERYLCCQLPIAMVSMDNCSHNGDKLYQAMNAFAHEWCKNGKADSGFEAYVNNREKVSFPWTMIDKITPRPDETIQKMLAEDGVEDMTPVITGKNTYAAPFVNAEECEYLVIEDHFPNGRPELEKGGLIFTDRETVDKVEKMKVCTCLNPLHTSLAVFGCLLGFKRICDEMEDADLKKLVEMVGYKEGLPVVVDPGVLNPKEFIDAVVGLRLPNPFMPDTPQRIATDTSQKLSVRFGETIKAYERSEQLKTEDLSCIPLVFAGWLRYLMAVDDFGHDFELSPDPLLSEVAPVMQALKDKNVDRKLLEESVKPVLMNESIFGVNLYEVGMANKVCDNLFAMMNVPGGVRETLHKCVAGNMDNMINKMKEMKIVPVVVLEDAKDAQPLAKALCAGGIPCAEVTFRTGAAKESIMKMREAYPQMLVGAGTVLTRQQVDDAIEAGAEFIVSPGFDADIVDYCIEREIPVFPGCVTPSEIIQCVKRGLKVIKFFPAEAYGGIKTIKALAAPFPMVCFMPTGGIGESNVQDYLKCPEIIACGGSWMVKGSMIKNGQFDEIEKLTRQARQLADEV